MSRLLMAIALAVLSVSTALAQDYPSRPLRIIVPFPAGGGVDTMARILANKMTDVVKQPVLVEHKPGAGGNVGTSQAAKATGPSTWWRCLPTSATAALRPIIAMMPLSLYRNGVVGSPCIVRKMLSAAQRPDCCATEPSWGSVSPAALGMFAASPTA